MNEPARRAKTLAWTSTAYFGEGLPYALLHQLVTEYLTSLGAPSREIGATSWFHLPVTLKPLWSPLVDLVGTRRGWTFGLQLAFGLGIALVGAWATLGHTDRTLFWAALGLLALMHAVHDIACDGFYMLALKPREQALYSGTRQAAYRAAMYVGGGALVLVAARFGWQVAFTTAGLLTAGTGLLNGRLLPHVDEPRGPAHLAPSLRSVYRSFFSQPQAWTVLAFVLTYRLGDVLTSSMSPVLMRELGLGLETRGWLRTAGLTSTIGGSVAAGWLLARGGLDRWFPRFTWFMAVPWYLVVAWLRPPTWAVGLAVVLEQLAGALAGTAATVFMMRRCARAFSASHYAFFTALVSLGSTAAGGFSGLLYERIGGVAYFALTLAASLPALWLVGRIPTHALDADPR
jgi:PAT family beta-lactamase induction signal transducer AmpG